MHAGAVVAELFRSVVAVVVVIVIVAEVECPRRQRIEVRRQNVLIGSQRATVRMVAGNSLIVGALAAPKVCNRCQVINHSSIAVRWGRRG